MSSPSITQHDDLPGGCTSSEKMSIAYLAPPRGSTYESASGTPSYYSTHIAFCQLNTGSSEGSTSSVIPGAFQPNISQPTTPSSEMVSWLPRASMQNELSSIITTSPSTSPDHYYGSPVPTMRTRRAPRLAYGEEQKFFIMYSRIVQDQNWPEIEDQFAGMFNQRSKGGLTSVYYRIRKHWGSEEVLQGGPQSFVDDKMAVEEKAARFSSEFLVRIGYLTQAVKAGEIHTRFDVS